MFLKTNRGVLIVAGLCLASGAARGLVVDRAALDLFSAVRSNRIEQVQSVLDESGEAAVHLTVAAGVTPLHVAAALDLDSMTAALLDRGADVEARTSRGFTPLHWAASRDAVHAARVLLERGANLEARSAAGITPLHWAANNNATNAVRLLLAQGADPLPKTDSGFTPLHWAVQEDAHVAAESLAFQAVTLAMEAEAAAAAEAAPEQEDAEPAPDRAESPLPAPEESVPMAHLPRPAFGRSLLVPLGFGEKLSFVWLERLGVWVGAHEITNGQYRRWRPKHNSMFHGGFSLNGNSQPVVYVSWEDALEFCRWLNKTHGDRVPRGCIFRLPTEVEWVTAARCGENRTYPWGNTWPPKYGNFSDLTARRSFANWRGIRRYDDGFAVTCPVYQSGANEWGIYGLAGNVWEWCSDWYSGARRYRLRKGGGWDFDGEASLRVDARGFDRPDARYDTIGIRLVVSRPGGRPVERVTAR